MSLSLNCLLHVLVGQVRQLSERLPPARLELGGLPLGGRNAGLQAAHLKGLVARRELLVDESLLLVALGGLGSGGAAVLLGLHGMFLLRQVEPSLCSERRNVNATRVRESG